MPLHFDIETSIVRDISNIVRTHMPMRFPIAAVSSDHISLDDVVFDIIAGQDAPVYSWTYRHFASDIIITLNYDSDCSQPPCEVHAASNAASVDDALAG